MNEFLSHIIKLTNNKYASNDDFMGGIAHAIEFLHNQNLQNVPQEFNYESFFASVWDFFISTSQNKSVSVRNYNSNATYAFLIRLFPFYPKYITQTFISAVKKAEENQVESAILPASFVFILNSIHLGEIENFISQTPITDQFLGGDTVLQENIPKLIYNASLAGLKWMKDIARKFMDKVASTQNRAIYKAVVECCKYNSKELIQYVLDYIYSTETITSKLNFVAFIIGSFGAEIDNVDVSNFTQLSLECLEDSESTISNIDSSLQIISKSKYYTLEILENIISFHFKNKQYNIPIERLQKHTTLYQLPLPIEYLIPKEEEGIMIISSKFATIGKNANKYKQEKLLDIFENFDTTKTELLSPFLIGLAGISSQIPPSQRLHKILTKYIFEPHRSWFHALDIVNLIDKTNLKYLSTEELDQISFMLFDLSRSQNEKLASTAADILFKISKVHNNIQQLLVKSEYFDSELLIHDIDLFKPILEISSDEYLNEFRSCLIDSLDFNQEDAALLSSIFDFLSNSILQSYELPLSIAWTLANEYLGVSIPQEIEKNQVAIDYISSKIFDIFAVTKSPIKDYYTLLRSSLKILANDPENDHSDIARVTLPITPSESSQILVKKWRKLSDDDQISLLQDVSAVLDNTYDADAAAEWCMCLHGDTRFKEFIWKSVKIALLYKDILSDRAASLYLTFVVAEGELDNKLIEGFDTQRIQRILRLCAPEIAETLSYQIIQNEPKRAKYQPPELSSEQLELFKAREKIVLNSQFSDDELMEMLNLFLKHRDIHSLNAILRYAERERKILLFLQIDIDESLLPSIFKYFAAVEHPQSEQFMEKYKDSTNPQIRVGRLLINSKTYLNSVFSMDRISNREAKFLCSILDTIQFRSDHLAALSLKLFQKADTPKRHGLALMFAINVAATIPIIPKEFLMTLAEMLTGREYNYALLGHLINQITIKTDIPSSLKDYIMTVLPEIGKYSYPATLIRMASLNNKNDPKLYINSSTLIENLMETETHSCLAAGLRLMMQCITALPDAPSISFLKGLLPKFLSKIEICKQSALLSDLAGNILTFIFSRQSFMVFQSTLIKQLHEILPNQYEPSFMGFAFLVPRAVSLGAIMPPMYVSPQPISLFKIALMCLRERVELQPDNDHKEELLIDEVTTWLDGMRGSDCPAIGEIIYEWSNLVLEYLGAQQVLTIIFFQFQKYINRFFPLFVAIARFARKLARRGEDVRLMIEQISAVTLTQTHSKAITLILEKGKMSVALKLASFPTDCTESNAIIQNCK